METVIRVALIYLFVLAALRIMGKREFGQLSPIELVTLLMIPEIVSQALQGQDHSLTNAAIGVATLLVLVYATSLLLHRYKRVEKLIAGEPAVLVRHGRLAEHSMNVNRVTPEELFSEMHKSGIKGLEQVEWAILEPDGRIAIVPTRDARASAGSGGGESDRESVA